MASGAKLLGTSPYRGFHIGWPGSGKTGALASLANAGYKLRVLDFEGNFAPLVNFVDERVLADPSRIDIVTLQDQLRNHDKYVEVVGIPDAFNRGLELLKEWKYKDDDGTEINLGRSADWGPDTVVVVDSATSFGEAAKRRQIKMQSKTPITMTDTVWGAAVADFNNALEIMKRMDKKYHLIINCHKQMLGPQNFIARGDSDEIKKEKLEAIKDGMIPTRIYPVGVSKPQAQVLHGMLPTMLEFEKVTKVGKECRIIRTVSGPEIDVKIPSNKLKTEYPIETGLADIFSLLGYKAPGF